MSVQILVGDALAKLRELPDGSVRCCVTSPPYWGLRDYGVVGQIGQEATPLLFVDRLVSVFAEVRRVLTDDGTLWLNIGDGYSAGGNGGGGTWGDKPEWATIIGKRGYRNAPDGWKRKELVLIPFLLASALSADGWYLRSSLIWAKNAPQEPPRVDRPQQSHEHIFLFAKSETYRFDGSELPHGSVWEMTPGGGATGHIAVFPPELPRRCILAGSAPDDTVLDPFGGAGTTGLVADRLGRNAILIELNPKYAQMAERRIHADAPLFADVSTSEGRSAQQ